MLRADPTLTIPGTFHDLGVNAFGGSPGGSVPAIPADVASCAQLATVPDLGRCPAGATAAAIPAGIFSPNGFFGSQDISGFTWPAANVPAARLDALGVDALGVETDGTTTAIEQARTVLETEPAYPVLNAPSTPEDNVVADVAAIFKEIGSPLQQMLLVLAAYAAYAINATQFLLKLRAARLQDHAFPSAERAA